MHATAMETKQRGIRKQVPVPLKCRTADKGI